MKIWLDDERKPPDESWTHITNPPAFRFALCSEEIEEISFDHDLGYFEGEQEITGYTCLCWVEKHIMRDVFPIPKMRVHTMNASARQKMQKVVDKLEKLRQTELSHWEGRVTE